MGLLGAAVAFTVIIIPPFAEFWYMRIGEESVFQLALVSMLVAIIFLLILPEALSKEQRRAMPANASIHSMVVAPLRDIFQDQGSLLWKLAVVRFLEGLATNGLMTIMLFTMTEVVDFTTADMASLFSLIGMCLVVVQGIVLPLFVSLGITELQMLLLAQTIRVVCYGTYSMLGFFPYKWVIYVLESLEIITTVWEPAFASLLTKSNEHDKGLALGTFSAIDSMTTVLSPLMMAAFFQISPTAPWLVAAILSVGTLSLVARLPAASASISSPEVMS